jgi:hypothetical protein
MSWGVIVELTEEQTAYAIGRGEARQRNAESKHLRPTFAEQYCGQMLDNHKRGACAELAVRKFYGFPLTLGVGEFFVPDIAGTNIEIRWSRNRDGCKVRHRDIEQGRVIVGTNGTFNQTEILGWIFASDAPARGRASIPDPNKPACIFVEELAWENPYTLTPDIYSTDSDAAARSNHLLFL